jgi:GntR family transcriptional regulator
MDARKSERYSSGENAHSRMFRDDGTPLYVQLASVLRRQIADGSLKISDQLPTLKDLVATYGVSPMTVRQAIAGLQKEGLISAERGRGTFVTANPNDREGGPHLLTTTPSTRISQLTFSVVASRPASGELAILPDDGLALDKYWYMKRLFFRRGGPFTIGEFMIGAKVYKAASAKKWKTELVSTLLYDTKEAGLANVRQTFRVVSSTPQEATELGIHLNDPVVRVRRIFHNARNEVICLAQLTYRTDGVVFDIHFDFKTRERLLELGGFPDS